MAGNFVYYMRAEPILGFARPVSDLPAQAAIVLYACAISRALGGDRKERRELKHQAELCARYRSEREEADGSEWAGYLKASGVPQEARVALMVSEWFDGSGPGRVAAEGIPRQARILSVAEHWAALTARGGPRLSQREALGDLDGCAGTRYDPRMVAAAHVAVERNLIRA